MSGPSEPTAAAGMSGAADDPHDLVDKAQRDGRLRFLGVELLIAPGALVPRPETELLGRTALEALSRTPARDDGTLAVVDMCCGSGNLACALAALDRRLRVMAADLTEECVALARKNVAHVGVADRVRVYQGDLFAALPPDGIAGNVDMIVCNPPYISTGRLGKDRAVLLDREPVEAFDGGPYGLSIHQRVLTEAARVLRPDGILLFEFGLGQERQLASLFRRSKVFSDVSFVADAHGHPRVAFATLNLSSHQKDSL